MWSFMETCCACEGGISHIVVVVIVFAVVLVVVLYSVMSNV